MKYRKKPVVVEARLFKNMAAGVDIAKWCGARLEIVNLTTAYCFMLLQTINGYEVADIGDWIIQGVKGEFYVCQPDIFDMTYEKAD